MTQTQDAQPAATDAPSAPSVPTGVNHLVLQVADIEASHHFWCDLLGFEQVGTLADGYGAEKSEMRFYSGRTAEGLTHHHLALIHKPDVGTTQRLKSVGMVAPIAHIAISYADQQAWLDQLRFMAANGVKMGRRLDHGMTHSMYLSDPNGYGVELLYEVPREFWEGDINAALNYADVYDAADALTDTADYVKFEPAAS